MSNNCFNRLTITAHGGELVEWMRRVGLKDKEPTIDFSSIVPLDDRDPVEVWGARYGCKHVDDIEFEPDDLSGAARLEVAFGTHWSGVEPLVKAIAHENPDWVISYSYFDEFNEFEGEVDAHIAAGIYRFTERSIVEPILSDKLYALFEPHRINKNSLEIELRELYKSDVRQIQFLYSICEGEMYNSFTTYLDKEGQLQLLNPNEPFERYLNQALCTLIEQREPDFWAADVGLVQFSLVLKNDCTISARALGQYRLETQLSRFDYKLGKENDS